MMKILPSGNWVAPLSWTDTCSVCIGSLLNPEDPSGTIVAEFKTNLMHQMKSG